MKCVHGVTIVELIIVIAIASLALLITTQTTMMAQRTLETGMIQSDAETRSGALIEQIANELKDGGARFTGWAPVPTTSNPNPITTSITFSRCSGFIMPAAGSNADPTPEFKHSITYSTRMIGANLCLERTETCLATAASPCQFGDPAALYGVPQTMVVATNLSQTPRSMTPPYTPQTGGFTGIRFMYEPNLNRVRILLAQDWRVDDDARNTSTADDVHSTITETVVNLKMDN